MAFDDELRAFTRKLDERTNAIFVDCTIEIKESITEGSIITGAPGQPVDTGYLKSSWIGEFVSDVEWEISTPADYAPIIEEGIREAFDPTGTPRPPEWERQGGTNRKGPSLVGGFHSVKLTRAGWPSIVDVVRARVVTDG